MFNLVQPLPRCLPLSEGSGQTFTPQNSASYSLVLCSISAFPMHHSYYGTCLHLQPQELVRSYTVLRVLQLCFGKSCLNTRPCCIKMLLYLRIPLSILPILSSHHLDLKSRTQDSTFAAKIPCCEASSMDKFKSVVKLFASSLFLLSPTLVNGIALPETNNPQCGYGYGACPQGYDCVTNSAC